MFVAQLHRLLAVCRGSDDGDVVLRLEERSESRAHGLLVVDDESPDRQGALSVGSTTCTSKPPPSASPAEKVPPASTARSRMPRSPWPSKPSPAGGPAA
jgi:hypothetical protein